MAKKSKSELPEEYLSGGIIPAEEAEELGLLDEPTTVDDDEEQGVNVVDEDEPSLQHDDDNDEDESQEEVEEPKKTSKKSTPTKGKEKKETKKVSPTKGKEEVLEVDFNELGGALKDLGIINDDADEFDKDIIEEKLRSKYYGEAETEFRDELNKILYDLNGKTGGLIEHLLDGGDVEDFNSAGKVEYYTKMKDTDVKGDKADRVLRDYYKKVKNFDDDELEEQMTRHRDLDEIDEKAKKVFPKLQDVEKKNNEKIDKQIQQKKIEKEKTQKKFADDVNKNLNSIKEFAGVKINKKLQQKVNENFANSNTFSKINGNFAEYLPKLILLDELGLLDGKIEEVEKVVKDKVAKDVQTKVRNIRKSSGGSSYKQYGTADIEDLLNNSFK